MFDYRIITVYEAFDGTQFEDEDDCEFYCLQKAFENIGDSLIMWDSHGEKTNSIESCYRVRLSSSEAVKVFRELAVDFMGLFCDHPTEIGEFYYVTSDDSWHKCIAVDAEIDGVNCVEYLTEMEALNALRDGRTLKPIVD